jgi:hypothetical protein
MKKRPLTSLTPQEHKPNNLMVGPPILTP